MKRCHRILYHHRIRAEDGQAVHVRELVGALRAAGHEVRECALVSKADAAGAPVQTPGLLPPSTRGLRGRAMSATASSPCRRGGG